MHDSGGVAESRSEARSDSRTGSPTESRQESATRSRPERRSKPEPYPGESVRLSIPITGMSCAACAARVQRKLEGTSGVGEAAVNFGSERALVSYDPAIVAPGGLVAVVRDTGYGARTAEVVLAIEGLEFAASTHRVERELGAVPGVLDAKANLSTGRARVEYISGSVPADALSAAVERAG